MDEGVNGSRYYSPMSPQPRITMYRLSIGPCRNDGDGDYYQNQDGSWEIIVSPRVGSKKELVTTLVHELIECILAEAAGISEPSIDAFDKKFEDRRKQGLETEESEPGEAKDSPYRRQHQFATIVESLITMEYNHKGERP